MAPALEPGALLGGRGASGTPGTGTLCSPIPEHRGPQNPHSWAPRSSRTPIPGHGFHPAPPYPAPITPAPLPGHSASPSPQSPIFPYPETPRAPIRAFPSTQPLLSSTLSTPGTPIRSHPGFPRPVLGLGSLGALGAPIPGYRDPLNPTHPTSTHPQPALFSVPEPSNPLPGSPGSPSSPFPSPVTPQTPNLRVPAALLSLRYPHVAVPEPGPGLPQFVSMGSLDGIPSRRRRSERGRAEPQAPGMAAGAEPGSWDPRSRHSERHRHGATREPEMLQDRHSQSRG